MGIVSSAHLLEPGMAEDGLTRHVRGVRFRAHFQGESGDAREKLRDRRCRDTAALSARHHSVPDLHLMCDWPALESDRARYGVVDDDEIGAEPRFVGLGRELCHVHSGDITASREVFSPPAGRSNTLDDGPGNILVNLAQ
jgi:hypothetical protein